MTATATNASEAMPTEDRYFIVERKIHGEPRWQVWDALRQRPTHKGRYTVRESAERELTRAMEAAA